MSSAGRWEGRCFVGGRTCGERCRFESSSGPPPEKGKRNGRWTDGSEGIVVVDIFGSTELTGDSILSVRDPNL
jgi:hypothetical protein